MDTEGTLLNARVHPADSHGLPAALTRGTEHAQEDQRRVLLGRVRIGPGAKRDATRNVPSGRSPTFLEGVVNDHHRLALIQLQYVADLPVRDEPNCEGGSCLLPYRRSEICSLVRKKLVQVSPQESKYEKARC